ncbi:hypothetical protein A2U01_0054166, partial [Trifolium medium]|nr:hypothetical protein [Trifolium medium]
TLTKRPPARDNRKFQGSKRLAARVVAERGEARDSDAKQKVSGLQATSSERQREAFAKRADPLSKRA